MELIGKDQEGPAVACPVIPPSPSFICVTAKSPTTSAQFVLPEISTVQQFKEDLAKHFNCETSQLVLVFFGRILKDHDTLQQCGISDGVTVHVLIRALKREQEECPQPAYGPRTSRHALIPPGSNLTLPHFGSSVQGSWAPPEVNLSGPEWQLVPTSEMIVQKVRQVILANPEVQQLAQQVPAISHILNNMDIMRVILDKMREIIELAKNPDMIQDLKNQDQALISMQSSIPGGDNPLRQLNGDMPEPGLNVVQDLFVASPYATMARSPSPEPLGLGCQGPRMESQEPTGLLPPSLSSTSLCSHGACSEEGGIFRSLDNPLGNGPSLPGHAPSPGAGVFHGGGLPTAEASEIPKLIVNLCNAYTKRLMFSLMQNALLASEGAQPAQQEQVQQQVLHFTQQMQSPEMVAAMSNPKAIQAWVQMEQGLQTLVAEAPVLLPWFMLRLRGLGCSGEDALGQEPTTSE